MSNYYDRNNHYAPDLPSEDETPLNQPAMHKGMSGPQLP